MLAAPLKISFILSVTLAVALSACLHTMDSAKPPATSPNPPAAETKKTHLELARQLSNYKNPQRNYQKAYAHLRVYVANADGYVNEETLNWMAALKEIDLLSEKIARLSEEIQQAQKELEKSNAATLAVQRTNQKLSREEILLREKNRKLEESNQKLEKTIEMLQNLDQRLEEKRKNFTN